VTPTKIHRITPCSIGRTPTCRTVAREIPVPIKYKVAVNPNLPITLNTCQAPAAAGTYVFATAAKQNNPINQGHCIVRLSDLFITAAPTETGTIHKARVSFTVVPTTNATAP